jgi:hypothetical protein
MIETMENQSILAAAALPRAGLPAATTLQPRQLQTGDAKASENEAVPHVGDGLSLWQDAWTLAFANAFRVTRHCLPAWRVRALWRGIHAAVDGAEVSQHPPTVHGHTWLAMSARDL